MYIGAWTEYRLAQEQAQSRRHDELQGYEIRPRKEAGIYHPSLSDKGGTDVARLPDRESFRRTLESALSSNLAADDAENISQALEPLMQRLPTIHPRAAATRRRLPGSRPSSATMSMQHRRRQHERSKYGRDRWEARDARCSVGGFSSRGARICSDAGTRSAGQATPDGTRSPRSGFSSASAPVTTAAGLDKPGRARSTRVSGGGIGLRGQRRRDRREDRSRMPPLPLIIGRRRRRQNSLDSDFCSNNNRGVSEGINSGQPCVESHANNSQQASAEGGGNTTTPDFHSVDKEAAGYGGYDSEAAATILRVARRRDPAGLKADFEQFWKWKRKGKEEHSSTQHGKIVVPLVPSSAPSTTRHPDKHGSSRTTAASGGRNSGVVVSKLEELSRRKAIYMAKGVTGSECTPGATTAGSPRRGDLADRPSLEPHPPDCNSNYTQLTDRTHFEAPKGTGEDVVLTKQRSRRGCGDSLADGESMAGRVAADRGSGVAEEDATVDIPNLELTDTRIKLVEKYFRGGGGSGGGVGGVPWPEKRPVDQDADLLRSHGTSIAVGSINGSKRGRESLSVAATAGNLAEVEGTSPLAARRIGANDAFRDPTDDRSCSHGVKGEASLHLDSGDGVRPLTTAMATTSGGSGGPQAAPVSPETAPPASTSWMQEASPGPPDLSRNKTLAGGSFGDAEGGHAGGTALSPEKRRLPSDHDTKSQLWSEADGATTLSPPATVAPAWCADNCSLEDLVCWTQGLDYDAAVEGF